MNVGVSSSASVLSSLVGMYTYIWWNMGTGQLGDSHIMPCQGRDRAGPARPEAGLWIQ